MALRVIGVLKFDIFHETDLELNENYNKIQYNAFSKEGVLYSLNGITGLLIGVSLIKINKCFKDFSGKTQVTFQRLNPNGSYTLEETWKLSQ